MAGESPKSGLSATTVDRARPREKAHRLSDRDGLYLLVKPSGARYWRMNFKLHQFQRTASFGRYPEITLAEVRQQGIDPVHQAGQSRCFHSCGEHVPIDRGRMVGKDAVAGAIGQIDQEMRMAA